VKIVFYLKPFDNCDDHTISVGSACAFYNVVLVNNNCLKMKSNQNLLPLILLFFGLFFSTFSHGQTKEQVKLRAIWLDTTNSDLERINAFFQSMNDFKSLINATPEETKWQAIGAEEAIQLAIKLDKKEYLPLFYLASSSNYAMYENDTECACMQAKKALESTKIANASPYAVFMANMFLSYDCSTTVKDEDLIHEFNKIKEGMTNQPEELELLRDLNFTLGGIFFNKNQYPKALKFTLESLRLSEELKLIDFQYAGNNQLLSIIHSDIGNYKESEIYGQKGLNVSRIIKDTMGIGSSYIGMASLMLKSKNETKAKHYIDSAIYIMRDVRQCEPCFNFAKIINAGIKNLSGNYAEALAELNEVEVYIKEQGVETPDGEFFIEKANAYLGLKKYDAAIEVITNSKELKESYFKTASNKYGILMKAYEAKGNFKKALEYHKQYVLSEDSLTVLRNSSEVTRLALENQYTQKQLQTELDFQTQLNKQKATRNWFLVLGVIAFLFAIGLFSRLQFIRKTQKLLQLKNEIIELEKEKAQASERAKHQFLANMSHEIRTPMNAIKGMTDILIRRNPKDDQIEYLNSIKQSSDSLLDIINDILDISKIEAGKIELNQEPFSVNDLVDNVYTIMQFKAEEKGLELKKDIPTERLSVVGDANRLRQILINLISNAIKFTEKGLVTTTVKANKVDDKLQLHFTVSDTGIGIDDDHLEKIFKSFEQAYSDTSRKFGGTGLGLSISKKLVELQHGKIWVESEKGKSSQFHFTIPYEIAETITQETNAEFSENIAGALKGINILLVEDNQFNVVVAQEELEDAIEGVNVEVAENGAIAVEKLKTFTFDIILMDVQMPIMNGYEATKAIRAFDDEKAKTPIIAMTANVLKDEVDLCYQAGMNDFIGKPFDINELLQKIFNLKNKNA
jgi:signal transduction histidine kinase/ActR/RegA family two-component response regulator